MGKTTIEQQFGAAMRFVRTLHERGFQARVSEHVGMQSSNLSEIITKDKGTFETTRRAVFEECVKLTPSLCGMTYETFLRLGDLILSGLSGEEALERARGMAGNYVLPKLHIRGAGHVVRNGVGTVVQHGGTEKTEHCAGDVAECRGRHGLRIGTEHCAGDVAGGDIEQDLSRMIAAHLEGKTLDEKIEFRAEVKRLMEADREERAQASAS